MLADMKLERINYADTPTGRKKYIVTLTQEERRELEKLTTTGRTAARTLRHAWVLLKADASPGGPRWTDEQIREAYGVSLDTIGRVRQAFVAEGVSVALCGRPRPAPPPRKMDGAQEAHLIALLCGPAPAGSDRWTMRLLADRFVQLEGSVPISRETVRRVLKKNRAQALAADGMVHSPGGERGVRRADGGRAGRVHPPRGPTLSPGLHGRAEQTTGGGDACTDAGRTRSPGAPRLRV